MSARPTECHTLVVGGGCIGMSIAAHLALAGAAESTVVVDKGNFGEGTTAQSSASIRGNYGHPALAGLARDALRIFQDFEAIYGRTAGFRQTGYLALFGPRDAAAAHANVAMQQDSGLSTYLVDPARVGELLPDAAVPDCAGAICEDEAGYAEPSLVVHAFTEVAREGGATLLRQTPVRELREHPSGTGVIATLDTGTISARRVVVAANAWSSALLDGLGLAVPVRATRHQIAKLAFPDAAAAPQRITVDMVHQFYLRPQAGPHALLGSSRDIDGHDEVDPDSFRRRVDEGYLEACAAYLHERYPGWESVGLGSGYCGVYDVSPDWQPLIGPLHGRDDVWAACGFSGHGFKHAPQLGRLIAAALLGDGPAGGRLRIFDPDRFERGEPIVATHRYHAGPAYR